MKVGMSMAQPQPSLIENIAALLKKKGQRKLAPPQKHNSIFKVADYLVIVLKRDPLANHIKGLLRSDLIC